eukprot:NODE_1669_length_1418_cov_28.395043_g1584_i0.p1 GENE.NODE_1669_length_1418_cov_28.395043_g1584_i0~~NODE_1669_length_1418_cov_28.395043_g1584_i0.p1  ORF type:complete len:439 (+),score=79.79 NODE_1669_length_1418_cov_28.395043_g1584_i0:50-1318(+)
MKGGVLAVTAIGIGALFQLIVPDPYMDEIFHIPQTEAYMRGELTVWDPKITTPPTLYLIASVFAWPLSLTGLPIVMILRGFNQVLHLAFFAICTSLLPHTPAAAYSLYLFPTLYFFSYLFYTDILSTLLVLAALSLTWRPRPKFAISAAVFGVAVTVRQTNIVWAFFCITSHLLTLAAHAHAAVGQKPILTLAKEVWRSVWQDCVAFLLLGVLSVSFALWNDGIVLGDKSNHQTCPHLAQLVYFFAFFTLMAPGYALSAGPCHMRTPLRSLCLAGASGGVASLCLLYFRYAHLFILSDNRHFTFYLWRRVFNTPLVWLCVLPLSIVGVLTAWRSIQGSPLRKLLFLVCTGLSIATSPLIEFRYYTIPFLLLYVDPLLAPKSYPTWTHSLHVLWYCCINLVTIALFLWNPFLAPDGSVGRFMW